MHKDVLIAAAGATGGMTSVLAALHVVNIFLGVAGGILALAAGWYHFRIKREQWRRLNRRGRKG